MENKKMTKKDYFNEVIKMATDMGRNDIVEFATNEINLLIKKASSKSETATQKANAELLDIIVDTLRDLVRPARITEIQGANAKLAELSNQKMSALLKKLVDTNVVSKMVDKRVAYFKVN